MRGVDAELVPNLADYQLRGNGCSPPLQQFGDPATPRNPCGGVRFVEKDDAPGPGRCPFKVSFRMDEKRGQGGAEDQLFTLG